MFKTISQSKDRLAVSPFYVGFILSFVVGGICYFLLPFLFPHLFVNGITNLLVDPHTFHEIAIKVATSEWSGFTFKPEGQLPSGVLALLYKITNIFHPSVMLPLLALLAGVTVSVTTSILELLGVKGRWWPLVFSIIFTVTPTSLSWFVYPHKDAFIVPGILLIGFSYLSVSIEGARIKAVLAFITGSVLVLVTKTYFAEIFVAGSSFALIISVILPGDKKIKLSRIVFLAFTLIFFVAVSLRKWGYSEIGVTENKCHFVVAQPNKMHNSQKKPSMPGDDFKRDWENFKFSSLVNRYAFSLGLTRARFLDRKSHGNTNFLPEVELKSTLDVVLFVPKVLQLALLEPLPWRTLDKERLRNLLFFVNQCEMLLVYLLIVALLFSGKRGLTPPVLTCLALSLPFLIAFGFATPNIGSINRYRFPFMILIKLAGIAAIWNSNRFKFPGKLLMWVDPPALNRPKKKLLFLVPDDATFIIQRLVMAQGAQKAGYDVHVACPDLGYAQKIRDLGFTFHNLDLNRGGLNPFADFMPFIRLVFFLSRERPDILQCVSIKPVIYGATAGTIVGLKRIVCLVNGLGYAFERNGTKGKIIFHVAKALYKNAFALPGIRVIFQNPDDRDYFINLGIIESKKTLLIRGSGVDMNKFKPTPQPQNSEPVILFVGRLLWSKGIRELIEAARTLKGENLSFKLQIVGAPDDRNPDAVPKEYLQEAHDKGIIDWLGRQTDMPFYYRQADVVALPTEYKEGLPLTLLEAASTGRTLITTDAPGCREIVRHGINGYLIPPKGVKELTNYLRILIQDPDLRKQFGENSARIVTEEFSAEIVQKQLVGVYDSLLIDSAPEIFVPATST